MDVPSRGVLENDTLQEHVLAVDQRNHYRAQETLDGIPLGICRSLGNVHVGILLSVGIALRGYPVVVAYLYTTGAFQYFLPLAGGHLRFLDGAPVLSVTIDDAVTCDSDVLTAIGRKRRLAATGFQTFERGLDDGVEVVVARE